MINALHMEHSDKPYVPKTAERIVQADENTVKAKKPKPEEKKVKAGKADPQSPAQGPASSKRAASRDGAAPARNTRRKKS